MLNCQEVSENATEFVDGEPSFVQRVSMRFHLLICTHCRRFFRQFSITSDTVAKLNEIPAPTDAEIDALVEKLSAAHQQPQ